MRIGQGFDVHRFCDGSAVTLGGVSIPFDKALEGHSDADVVLHAIMDALLGSLALGDIGMHFPNTDKTYRGADSRNLTRHVWRLICDRGYRVGNIDVMIMAEKPKISPYVEAMRTSIAELVECSVDDVSVKATTMEGLGFVGRGEGICAQAVVLLKSS